MTFRKNRKPQFTPEWCESITVSALNDANEDGRNILMGMASSREGRRVIDEDDEFRQKITSEGFCLLRSGASAAGHFLSAEDGLQILLDHSDLLAKLNADCVNAASMDSLPKIYWVTRFASGLELLANPSFRNLVSAKGLNAACMFRSALYYITASEDGIAFLVDDVFRKKIMPKGLNALEENGAASAVYNLCQSEFGRQALLEYKDLRNKIEADALNARSRGGTSALYHLARTATGREVLAASWYLRGLIDINALHEVCVSGPDKGASPLFWLIANEDGREILKRDWRLRAIIEPRDVHVRHEKDNVSVADLLLLPASSALLKKLSPEVQKAVEEYRQRVEGSISGWHASMTLFAPQKKSPQMSGEIVEEQRCVIL